MLVVMEESHDNSNIDLIAIQVPEGWETLPSMQEEGVVVAFTPACTSCRAPLIQEISREHHRISHTQKGDKEPKQNRRRAAQGDDFVSPMGPQQTTESDGNSLDSCSVDISIRERGAFSAVRS